MEKHIFKLSEEGEFKFDDFRYDCKCVLKSSLADYKEEGWFETLKDAANSTIKEEGSDYEAELRFKIKELGGKPGGRSSIETLEKQLEELKDAD